jgi:hypothetical protein
MSHLITNHRAAFAFLTIKHPEHANYNSQSFLSLILFFSSMVVSYFAFGWWGVLLPWIVGGVAANYGKNNANEFVENLNSNN